MSTTPALRALAPGNLLADRAYGELRTAILEDRLTPGTPLSVPALADQMNISRSPVREAVQRLIHDGLATHVPHRGAEVSSVDVDDLRQLYAVRELLEGLAARAATERMGVSEIEQLRAILDEHDGVAAATDGAESAHVAMDMRFHRAIRAHSGNPHLIDILDHIEGKAHLGWHTLWRHPHAPGLALGEHRRIYEAIAAGDPDAAEQAARSHVARLRVRLSQVTADDRHDPPQDPQP